MPININITCICSSLNELTTILEYIKSNYPEILIQVSPIDSDGARGKEQGHSDSLLTSTGALSPQPSARSDMPPSDSLGGVPADLATLKAPAGTPGQSGSQAPITSPPDGHPQPGPKPACQGQRIPPTPGQLRAVKAICEHRIGASKCLDNLLLEHGVKEVGELDKDVVGDFIELYPMRKRGR